MEDEAEKMVALKKAYADVILNTAKEAATRITASERKALSFQEDLWSAKEEGLRLLLHLKQMLDSKIDEAATTNASQRRTIEELEAQLFKAEEIITDLRIELKSVQNELRKAMEESTHDDRKPVSGSTVMRPKDPGTFNESCTQRIHAFEGNFLDENFLPEDGDNQLKKSKSVAEIGEETVIIAGSSKINSGDIVKKRVKLAVLQLHNCSSEDKPAKVIHNFRRRRTPRLFSTKYCRSQLITLTQLSPTLSNTKACSIGLKEKSQVNRSCFKDKSIKILDKELGKRKLKHSGISAASPKSTAGQITKLPVHNAAKSSGDLLEITDTEAKMKMLPADLHSVAATPSSGQDVDEDKDLVDVTVLVKHETDASESRKVRSCKMEDDRCVSPLTDVELTDAKIFEVMDGDRNRVDDDKCLKHTFQRKHKRKFSSSSDENTSLGKGTAKRWRRHEGDGVPKQQKCSMINESTRDSRRLAQVARQLISLSGERW